MPLGASIPVSVPEATFERIAFADLPGWAEDDHAAALAALRKSAHPVMRSLASETDATKLAIVATCQRALDWSSGARDYFETTFVAHRVRHADPQGLLTGYYEPVLDGSRTRTDRFHIPILRRPADLINLVAESQRGAMAHALTHARKTASGQEPYATRADIEEGALAGQGLELVWLDDPVDAFFTHIQGSGRIRFEDGSLVRITYDGKNGHPYTSIGRYLIDAGLFAANDMSLDALKEWLKADLARGKDTMRRNTSYVFFRELSGAEGEAPMGVLEIALSEGRSLAVDTRYHSIGLPVYVVAPSLMHGSRELAPFQRLMIGQDVGSAIRGPERGDIYFGSGDEVGALAGITKHPGNFYVLLPRVGL